jgi:hypothetical protein
MTMLRIGSTNMASAINRAKERSCAGGLLLPASAWWFRSKASSAHALARECVVLTLHTSDR